MIEFSLEQLGLIVVSAIFLSMLLVPVASRFAYKVGAIDIPKHRSSHAIATPRLGGLAIAISLAFSCLFYLPLNAYLLAFVGGLFVVVLTGVIDDIFQISPRLKFLGQIAAAVIFVYFSGVTIYHIGSIVGTGDIGLGKFSFAFTVFCLVGGMNAFNLCDGLDGLAGGLSLIAAVFFAYFAWSAHLISLLVIALILIGATLGFLRFNAYPARIFMGDSGSLMLGYVLSVLLASLVQAAPTLPVPGLVLVIALPLLDTLFVMGRRVRYGHSPFLPDRRHLHHLLVELGLPHPVTVAVIYLIMLTFGLLSILLSEQSDWLMFVSLLSVGCALFLVVSLLQKRGFRIKSKRLRSKSSYRQFEWFKKIEGWLKTSSKSIGILVVLLLILPAFVGPLIELNGRQTLSLALISILMAGYSWQGSAGDRSILSGIVYLAIWVLLLIYGLSNAMLPSWLGLYISITASLVLVWVLLKMFFSDHKEIVFTSGFELLILFFVWFVPFVVLEEMKLPPNILSAIKFSCFVSIPFLLAMKINIRIFGERGGLVIYPIVIGLMVIALRGFLH